MYGIDNSGFKCNKRKSYAFQQKIEENENIHPIYRIDGNKQQ